MKQFVSTKVTIRLDNELFTFPWIQPPPQLWNLWISDVDLCNNILLAGLWSHQHMLSWLHRVTISIHWDPSIKWYFWTGQWQRQCKCIIFVCSAAICLSPLSPLWSPLQPLISMSNFYNFDNFTAALHIHFGKIDPWVQ